jgi:hypothetical protein
MHVVIDLGEMHSYLACWEIGKSWEDASIRVKLPGVAAFCPAAGNYSWERENLREYFSFIHREYLIPSRMIIESAALAIPSIFNLATRRILLDVLEEIFGLYEASIIPHPIALIAGILMGTSHLSLSGDILVIEAKQSGYNFAFVSIIDTLGITLEKQFSGDLADVLAEADRNAYHSGRGWHLDHILLSGYTANNPATAAFITSLPPDLNVIYGPDLEFTAAEGLAAGCNDKGKALVALFNIVYPYEFYLGKNESTFLERITFDTANLELNCGGRYRIANLHHANIGDWADDENRVHICIYEVTSADQTHIRSSLGLPHPVLEIDGPFDDLPPHFELSLDMAAATIQLEIPEALDETIYSPEVLEKSLWSAQYKLYQLLSRNQQNETLVKDWSKSLQYPLDHDPSLSEQVNLTMFHLYGLLQLWQGK